MRLSQVAEAAGLEWLGDEDVEIKGLASLEDAEEGDLVFLRDASKSGELSRCRASAFIIPRGVEFNAKPRIVAENVMLAFAKAASVLYPAAGPRGVDKGAIIEEGVVLGDKPSIYPNVYIGKGAVIGDRVTLYPGVFIGPGCKIGEGSILYANAVVNEGSVIGKRAVIHGCAVIGSDGFGFVWDGKGHRKIPQIGGVEIGDDVEIGANTTVDRATLGKTRVGNGAKIDNLVMVSHNCSIGDHAILISQVGLAGSTIVGKGAVLAGQVGVAGHLTIGDGAVIGAKSGVTKDVEAGAKVTGYPPKPHRDWMRIQNAIEKLPEMRRELKALAEKIEEMEKKTDDA